MILTLVILGVIALAITWRLRKRGDGVPFGLKKLPGPKGWPIIGSVPEVPEKLNWIKFADWGKEYGPIYQVNLAGDNHVWISTDEIARDLLSKKGPIYSDRPHIPALLDDNRDSGQYLPLMSKNDLWARQRKFANHIMRASEAANFHDYPELEAIRLCHELMEDPENYNHHLESFVSRVTCRLAWGHGEGSDELKQRARELLIGVSPTGALGNKIPFIMSLPDWLSPSKAWERHRARTERKWFRIMQDTVRDDIAEGKANPSWMKLYFDAPKLFNFADSLEGAYAVGMHGIAGALTIAAPMQTFCLAMCHHPQYLTLLQEELDRVCPNRLPTNADKPNLPVLRAIIKECIRWRPPVPTGIPHYLIEDDEYQGHHIPKGSVIHPLEWSICRDPDIYPNPDDFNPLRWLKPEYPTYKEPLTQYPTIMNMTQFGYGRRTCQGQAVTEADLIAALGSVAWLFDLQNTEKEASARRVMLNEEATMSEEDLMAGLSKESSGDDDDIQRERIGGFDLPIIGEPSTKKVTKHREKVNLKDNDGDPTLRFTTLLIAKPLPFKFGLQIRDDRRARLISDLYDEKRSRGEYTESKEYWGKDHGKGQEYGWVKV